MKRTQLRFVWLSVLSALVFILSGCARPDGVIIASPSYLGTSAQLEQQTIRESIPPDLRKRLREAVAESQAQAASMGAHRQYLAQMPNPNAVVQQKLLEAVLKWAGEKTGEERLVLQHRRATFEGIVAESRDPDKPKASWKEHPKVQYGAGVVSGAAIGTVPLGPYAADVAIELRVLPEGTYHARVGKCAGELISGVIQMAVGCSGMTTGIGMTGTGGGAPAGIVVISASFALAANGYATAEHAVHEARRLYKEGPPPDAPAPAPQEQLLKPKAKPQTAPPAQAAPAKPAPQAQQAKAATTAPTQAEAAVKPKATTPYIRPNGGTAKPHGGEAHNRAIDREVQRLSQDPSVSNIRKNQRQVDVDGKPVGTNRPDVQYDKQGCHNCVEFDTKPSNGLRHGDVIQKNDPATNLHLKTP